jgi:hypothetical protein
VQLLRNFMGLVQRTVNPSMPPHSEVDVGVVDIEAPPHNPDRFEFDTTPDGVTSLQGRPYDIGAETYDDQSARDTRHGVGAYTWTTGDVCAGRWTAGEQSGIDRYTWATGDARDGRWVNGTKHGIGTYRWTTGDVYEGQWADGHFHGTGTYTWAKGDVYDGRWAKGKRHGRGTLTKTTGDVYECNWADGAQRSISKRRLDVSSPVVPYAKRPETQHAKAD